MTQDYKLLRPYTALAPVYDHIMKHVCYKKWLKLIKDITSHYSIDSQPEILELGMGTGTLGALLHSDGFRHQGLDLSLSMCVRALQRNVRGICADARYIPVKKRYPFIIFLYDGINYLSSMHDYTRLFKEISDCLRPGGLFLFDITTEYNSVTYFLNSFDSDEWKEIRYIRHSHFDRDKKIQYNDFIIYTRDTAQPSLFTRVDEHHVQYIFDVAAIIDTVPADLFSLVGAWDSFSFRPYTQRSERIHFLLKKR